MVAALKERLAAFNAERDWAQFHTPKDLAAALSVEAAELLELFLWSKPDAEVDLVRVREELADVVITALNFANRLEIDVADAVEAKIALNAERYPVDRCRGRADKYDQLP